MTRKLALLAGLAVAVTGPSTALAHTKGARHHHKKAKVLRANLLPVGADAANYLPARGKAQMVVNKRRAKISVHVRKLQAGATHQWALLAGGCEGTPVEGWTYKSLRVKRSGNASATGRAKGFRLEKGTTYAVVVYAAGTTEPLLCGELKRKRGKGGKGGAPGKGKGGKGRDESRDRPKGQGNRGPGIP